MSGGRTASRNRIDYVENKYVVRCVGPRVGEANVGVYEYGGRVWQISFAPLLPNLQIELADLFYGPDAVSGAVCGAACRNTGATGANKRTTSGATKGLYRNVGRKRAKVDNSAAANGDADEPEEWIRDATFAAACSDE